MSSTEALQSDLQELAAFSSEHGDALSFYFGPQTPTELAHREEPILAKEKIQQVFTSLQGSSVSVRQDIDRLLQSVAAMKGNESRAKVIFACGSQQFWREYDIDGSVPLRFEAGRTFSVAPLLPLVQRPTRYCIALADRNRARLLILEGDTIREHSDVLDEERDPELDKVRTTGTGGSRHVERQREEMVRQHFQFLASHLLHFHEHKDFDALLVGCRDTMWPEIEAALHADLKRVLVGHFRIDPGLAPAEEVKARAEELVREAERQQDLALLERAVGGAAADGLGAVGLSGVLRSIEKGEVQMLVWTPRPQQQDTHAIGICSNCGHLKLGERRSTESSADPGPRQEQSCDLCGSPMKTFARAEEALARRALLGGFELRMIKDAALPPPDEFAAVLRFRSDHNTAQALAS